MDEQVQAPTENATPAPPDDGIEIVAAEKPDGAPEGQVGQQPNPMILGKFKSPDDVIPAYVNLEQEAGRLRNELGNLRKEYEQAQYRQGQPAQPAPAYPNQFDPEKVNEQFRDQLERDPFGTLMNFAQMVSNQTYEQRAAAQRESFGKFQQYAQDPFFADVASEAAQMYAMGPQQISPEEGVLLRAKIAKLQQALNSGGSHTPAAPPHIEGAGASRSGGMRLELGDDKSIALMNGVGNERATRLARMVAKKKQNGGDTKMWSIDDWEAANA